jgi:hypothetical protein
MWGFLGRRSERRGINHKGTKDTKKTRTEKIEFF